MESAAVASRAGAAGGAGPVAKLAGCGRTAKLVSRAASGHLDQLDRYAAQDELMNCPVHQVGTIFRQRQRSSRRQRLAAHNRRVPGCHPASATHSGKACGAWEAWMVAVRIGLAWRVRRRCSSVAVSRRRRRPAELESGQRYCCVTMLVSHARPHFRLARRDSTPPSPALLPKGAAFLDLCSEHTQP
jgi:hypothetical protein